MFYIQKLVNVQKYVHIRQKLFYIGEKVRTLNIFCVSFCLHKNIHKKKIFNNTNFFSLTTKQAQKLRNYLKTGTKMCIKK